MAKFKVIEFIQDCPTLKQKKGAIVQVSENVALSAIARGRAKMYDLGKAEKEAREKREAKAELKAKAEKEAKAKEKKVINDKKETK
jgi:hypothetical protein